MILITDSWKRDMEFRVLGTVTIIFHSFSEEGPHYKILPSWSPRTLWRYGFVLAKHLFPEDFELDNWA